MSLKFGEPRKDSVPDGLKRCRSCEIDYEPFFGPDCADCSEKKQLRDAQLRPWLEEERRKHDRECQGPWSLFEEWCFACQLALHRRRESSQ